MTANPQATQAPKIEPQTIDALMASLAYHCHRVGNTTTTVATAMLPGGFSVAVGISAFVSPLNFCSQTGIKLAIKDAEAKARAELWKLEGYALHKRLADPGKGEVGEASTWQQRLVNEHRQLSKRIDGLTRYISGGNADLLPAGETELLLMQLGAMSTYERALSARMQRANLA